MYAELRAALKRNGHYETLRLRERAEQRNRNGSEGECGVMDVESEKSEKPEKPVCREADAWRDSELDGFWFFGLNIPQVVEALEAQEASLYHAFPPAGYPSYRYHQVQPRVEQVIRVREERVEPRGGSETQFEESQIQRVPTRRREANGVNGVNGVNGANGVNGVNGVNGTIGTIGTNGTNGTIPAVAPAPPSPEKAMCSRCVPVQTTVTPLAWTLSTLRQTLSDARSRPAWEAGDTLGTTELLRQYRALQVGAGRAWNVVPRGERAAESDQKPDPRVGTLRENGVPARNDGDRIRRRSRGTGRGERAGGGVGAGRGGEA